jgi:peptidoglycan/LPS O-acetylase OafA/YrhL
MVIKHVQVLRALASLMVIFMHLQYLMSSICVYNFGWQGVDLFFVISGFVMVFTTKKIRPSWAAFFLSRIARIVPFYWFMTLSVYLVALIFPSLLQSTNSDIYPLFSSLLFIPFVKSNGLVEPILFVGWTLNYEMFFYLIFAVGLLFHRYYSGILFIIFILGSLCIAGQIFPTNNVILKFYSDQIILEFAMGMCVALVLDAVPMPKYPATPVILLSSLLAALVLILAPNIFKDLPRLLTAGVPATVLLAAVIVIERRGNVFNNTIMLAIGDASYALYLSHPYVTQVIEKIGQRFRFTEGASIFSVMVTLFLAVIFALLIHKMVEKPLSSMARRLLA